MDIDLNLLQTPSSLHGRHAAPNDAYTYNNATKPHSRTQSCHNEVRWRIEEYITDVEECKTGRDLLGREMEDLGKVVT